MLYCTRYQKNDQLDWVVSTLGYGSGLRGDMGGYKNPLLAPATPKILHTILLLYIH